MEPLHSYLLAVGADHSLKVVQSLGLGMEYIQNVTDTKHADQGYYLHLEVTESGHVVLAVYHSHQEASDIMGPEFKVIVNH